MLSHSLPACPNPVPLRPRPSPCSPSPVSVLACALARLRPRLASLLASPRLVSLLASPRLPVSFFLPPVSRHLPPPFPVSVLPPSPVSLRSSASSSPCCFLLPSPSRACFLLAPPPPSRASASASPSSPSLSPLRLCFFLVGEAAVEIQLRRSLLSSCRDPSPPVGAHLSHHIPSSPSPALVHICLRLYFFPMGISACKFGFRRRHLLAGDEIWYSSSSIYTHRLPLLLLLLSSVFFISHCRYSSSSIYTHIFEGGRVGGVGVEGGHELAAAVDGVVFEACSVKGFRGWQGRWRVVVVVVALERAVEE